MPIMPASRELRQDNHCTFEASLATSWDLISLHWAAVSSLQKLYWITIWSSDSAQSARRISSPVYREWPTKQNKKQAVPNPVISQHLLQVTSHSYPRLGHATYYLPSLAAQLWPRTHWATQSARTHSSQDVSNASPCCSYTSLQYRS